MKILKKLTLSCSLFLLEFQWNNLYFAWNSLYKKPLISWESARGPVLCDIEAHLTRNLCECIVYFYGEICGILENVPRFPKNAFHILEERHLGLASLYLYQRLPAYCFQFMCRHGYNKLKVCHRILNTGQGALIFHICKHCGKSFSSIQKYITLTFDPLLKMIK